MRKLLLVLGLAAGLQLTYAQRGTQMELPNRLFTQGKEMFLDKNYVGCLNTLDEFKQLSKDASLKQEADYMIASSYYYQGKENVAIVLKEYLETYPETYHRNQLCFFIGSSHFAQKDWKKAMYWLGQSDMDYLSVDEQEDYSYRAAYANLQAGSKVEAKRLFGLLSRNSTKYADPASYYLAYISFQDKEYASALPIFQKLKSKSEYKENATFYIIQGSFFEGNQKEVIASGEEFLRSYPSSDNKAEVNRMLGSCYYNMGETRKALQNYEQYLSQTESPFREDLYQIGEAYYRTENYTSAIKALEKVASSADLLGQAGNMLLGQSHLNAGNTANALMAFDAASRVSFDPVISEEALYNFVVLTNKEGGVFGASVSAFQRFLSRYPKSKYADDVNSALATTLLSTKNYNMALEAINEIKSPGRQILDAKQVILFELGVQHFLDGNYKMAISQFDKTLAMGDYNAEAKNEAHFWRGDSYYHELNYPAALKDYTAYTQSSVAKKNNTLALYNMGYANFQLKNIAPALADFRKYVAAEKDTRSQRYADALNRIGDCYLYTRDFSSSEKIYAQAVSTNGANADYSEFQRAFVLGLQKNYSGKISALNDMMARYPDSRYYDNAMFEKSRALVMQSKEWEAIAVLEKLLKDKPNTTLAQKASTQLGQLYFNVNEPQKSIEAYKRVVVENPNSEDARVAIKSMESVYKDIDDVGSYVNYVNSLGGKNILSVSRQDSLTYLSAENAYMKGNKTNAKAGFTKYLQSYPRGYFASDANFYLGNIAFEAKEFPVAMEKLKAVIDSRNPKYLDDALIMASGIDFDDKNYESAYKAYKYLGQTSTKSENKDVADLGMLRCAFLLHKDSEVIDAANKLLANSKASAGVTNEARFYRGKSYKNSGKNTEAIADLQTVAKNTRTAFGAESQYLLAQIYYDTKAYDKADKQVQAFMKEGTSYEYWMARAIIVLSDVYAAKGDRFQARQYVESLQANYKGVEQDISDMISKRLATLNQ